MTFPLPSPYPPAVDAHIWRGYRPVRGQLSVGLLMQRADEAEQWATSVLNLLIADPAVKLDAVFRAADVPVRTARDNSLFRSLRSRRRAALFQAVRLRVRPACCFIDVEYDSERNVAARARGLDAPYIPGGRDPDPEPARREERFYLRLLIGMVIAIVLAGFLLGIVGNLVGAAVR